VTLRFKNSASDPENIDDTLARILFAIIDRITPPLPPSTNRGGRQTL